MKWKALMVLAVVIGVVAAFVCVQSTLHSSSDIPETMNGLTREELKEKLSPLAYQVIVEKGTERPFTGELLKEKRSGTYVTALCKEPVFRAEQKFESGTGWPSFWAPISEDAIRLVPDYSLLGERTEVVSAKCGEHLGHVFDDGPPPTGKRYCLNSVALEFIPDQP